MLRKNGVSGLARWDLVTGTARIEGKQQAATLVPYSLYASLWRPRGEVLPMGREGEAILVYPFYQQPGARSPAFDDQVAVGSRRLALHLLPDQSGRLFNADIGAVHTLILPDATFEALLDAVPESERLQVAIWNGE